MSIKPMCDKCGNELQEFGAILFSPPSEENLTKKHHVCADCYKNILKEFSSK